MSTAMTQQMQDAVNALEQYVGRRHWLIGKGRNRAREPLYAVAVYDVGPDGVTEDEPLVIAEGHTLAGCVDEVVAKFAALRPVQ